MTDFDHSRSREFGYFPYRPPEKYSQEYIENELRRIGAVLDTFGNLQSPVFNAEPDRPRDGMIRYADGTNWDPTGDGEGYYGYWAGAWHFFGGGAGPFPDTNRVVGGSFTWWQDGTSFTPTSGATNWFSGRFYFYFFGTAAYSVARQTDTPHAGVPYSVKVTATTGEAGWAPGDLHYIETPVPVSYLQELKLGDTDAEPLYVSFWAKASDNGTVGATFCFILVNSNFDMGYYTLFSALKDTWTRFEYRIDGPTSGTWSSGALRLRWSIGAQAANQTTTADAWHDPGGSTKSGLTGQTLMNTNGFLQIADVRLGIGPVETVPLDPYIDLMEEQKFYEKSYDIDVAPGTVDTNGCVMEHATRNNADATRGVSFKAEKFNNPTVTIYATGTGNSGKLTNNGDKTATAAKIGTAGFGEVTITSGDSANDALYHWVADIRGTA
jgi:hypothetical protein